MIGQPPSFPPCVSLFILPSQPALSISSATDLLFRRHNESFYAVNLQSQQRKTHIYQCQGEANTNPRRGVFTRVWMGTLLMKYLSLAVHPAVPVRLFLPLLLYTTLISARLTCHHISREFPAGSCLHLMAA